MQNLLNIDDKTKGILRIIAYGLLGFQYILRVIGRVFNFMVLRKQDGSCKEGISIHANIVYLVVSLAGISGIVLFAITGDISTVLATIMIVIETCFILADIAYILYYRRIRMECKNKNSF